MNDTNARLTDKKFMRLFFTSILCIVMCGVSLVTASFALFTNTLETKQMTLKAATYDVIVTEIDGDELEIDAFTGDYKCEAGKVYAVTLVATGTASEGYAIVTLSPTEIYYSEPLKPGDSTTFTITRDEDFQFNVRGHWGKTNCQAFENNEAI